MKLFLPTIKNNEQQGFVLLFSVLVSAVIFFIGAGIFSISFKELLISSLGKESQKSIFAADSAVECALQADTDQLFDGGNALPASHSCFGMTIIGDSSRFDGINTYNFTVPFAGNICAKVTVIKPDGGTTVNTTIYAQGFNKCDATGPVVTYPGLTERVYRVTF